MEEREDLFTQLFEHRLNAKPGARHQSHAGNFTRKDRSSVAHARRPLEAAVRVTVATTAEVAKQPRRAERAGKTASEPGATPWTSSCLPRPARPPPPLAGPRGREDAPQEPGSRPSGLAGAPDAPPILSRALAAARARGRDSAALAVQSRHLDFHGEVGTREGGSRPRPPPAWEIGDPFRRPCGGSGR